MEIVVVPQIMFRSSSHKQTKLPTYSDDEFDLEEADFDAEFGLHPLDTYSSVYRAIHELFFGWVFRIIKAGNLSYDKIPPVPTRMRSKFVFRHWQTIYNQRKQRNLSTNTLQMIWHSFKCEIIKQFLYQIIGYFTLLLVFVVVKNGLWEELGKINKNNSNAYNVFKYALFILFIFCVQRIILNYGTLQINYLLINVKSCLLLSLYTKTLSLDINECDKQKVLNLMGTDAEQVRAAIFNITAFGAPLIVFLAAMVALYLIVGVSAIFGIIFVLFIGFPLQLFLGLKLSKYTRVRMKFADQRIQLITESVRGIRVLKVCCYELPLMDKINEIRANELKAIKQRNYFLSLLILSMFMIPALMLVITLFCYMFVFDNEMDSDVTVFTLMLFSMVQLAVKSFPGLFSSLATISTSAGRIDKFHAKHCVEFVNDENITANDLDNTTAIDIKEGSFEWSAPTDENDGDEINLLKTRQSFSTGFRLTNISLKIKRGKLVAIIGSVGCGKSSLLQAILQEMKCVSGELKVNLDEIVYLSQVPYIRNLTLRDNIILELPFDETVYKECILNSALLSDLHTLENSDLTVIGDEGVNLSGGQKMRIAFARTLYRNGINKHDSNNINHIFIFDDPLSCVDIYVGRHMFLDGIHKYLMKKNNESNITCIVVLNSHLHLLKYFDEIVIMDKGQIGVHSTVNDLFYSHKESEYLLKYQHLLPNTEQLKESQMDINYIENIDDDRKQFDQDFDIDLIKSEENLYDLSSEIEIPTWKLAMDFVRFSLTKFDYKSHWFPNTEKAEKAEKAKNNLGLLQSLIPLILSTIVICCTPICDVWILFWNQEMESNQDNDRMKVLNVWYLFAWLLMLSIVAFSTVYAMRLFTDISLKASDYVHSKSLFNILRANVLFYDLTPRGDIINRFSLDTDIMDIQFVQKMYLFIIFAASTLGYFVLIIIFIPLALVPMAVAVPILVYFHIKFESVFFVGTALMKQRQSFVASLFSETVVSLDTIRSYALQSYFVSDLQKRIDNTNKCDLMCRYLGRAQSLLIPSCINVLQFFVTLLCIYQIELDYKASQKQFIILALWYFANVQMQIFAVAVMYVFTKSDFTSVMRIMHYHSVFEDNAKFGNEMIHEPTPVNADYEIQNQTWPTLGNIDITKLQLKYRKKFQHFQLDIDHQIKIKMGDKIGICGRTGSGKSSILTSIFRLFEPASNDAVIDGLSLAKLGLYDLRSNLSIVSQDPVLFSGNLRFNLDPYNDYSENELWSALGNVECAELIHNRKGKLECKVAENGSNFSVGERQLICFARSVLLKSPVWFLDEPTSSIDKNTDNIIQTLIRSPEFDKVTVICIAHRLQTIIDYDYILLLQNGKVKEYDTPHNLLKDQNGDFSKLVQTDKLYYRM